MNVNNQININIFSIIETIEKMFQYVENDDGTNEILIDRSNLTSGVTIYWEDTNFTPIFHSLLINNLFYHLKNLIILSDNDDEVVFIYNNFNPFYIIIVLTLS